MPARVSPLYEALRAHVFAAARIHGDDTPIAVLAPGKTRTGRLWTYVRDDQPFEASTRLIGAASMLAPFRRLRRNPPDRRLCGLQQALRRHAAVLPRDRSSVLRSAYSTRAMAHPDKPDARPGCQKLLTRSLHMMDTHDRGGNEVIVTFNGRRTNLHARWDHRSARSRSPGSQACLTVTEVPRC